MKRIPLLCLGALLCALCMSFNELNAQTATWDYPVKPGTPEWTTFETHDQMLEAIQIPESILRALTTKELVEICLNYPLYGDIFAYNSLQDGFRSNVSKNFNGIQELFRRKDNAQCLLNVLKNYDLLTLESREHASTDLKIGESIWKHSFLEVLMSQESVLTNANAEQQREIAVLSARNMLIKERREQVYGYQSLESSAYLLGTTLKTGNSKATLSPNLERFLKDGTTCDVTLMIEELVNNYIKF